MSSYSWNTFVRISQAMLGYRTVQDTNVGSTLAWLTMRLKQYMHGQPVPPKADQSVQVFNFMVLIIVDDNLFQTFAFCSSESCNAACVCDKVSRSGGLLRRHASEASSLFKSCALAVTSGGHPVTDGYLSCKDVR